MSHAWMMLSAGALKLYDGSKLLSKRAVADAARRQVQKPGEPMPPLLPPKPRDDAHGHPVLTQEDVKVALGGLADAPFRFGMAAFLGDMSSLEWLEHELQWRLMAEAEAGGWITRREHRVTLARMSELLLFEVIVARSRNDAYPGKKPDPAGSARVLCPKCLGKGRMSHGKGYLKLRQLRRLRRIQKARRTDSHTRTYPEGHGKRLDRMTGEVTIALTRADRTPLEACDICEGDGTFLLTDVRRARALDVHPSTWHRIWGPRYAESILIPQRWEEEAVRHVRRRLAGSRGGT